MGGGIASYLRGGLLEALHEQSALQVFLGVGIDGHLMPQLLCSAEAFQQVPGIGYGFARERSQERSRWAFQTLGHRQPQLQFSAVKQEDVAVAGTVGRFPNGLTEASLDPVEGEEEVFAGAEGIFPKIRTVTIRFAALPTAQGHAIGFSRNQAGNGVVGPEGLRVHGLQFHLFGGSSLLAVGEGLGRQFFWGELSGRAAGWRGRCQVQCQLFFENDRQCGAGMVARLVAGAAAKFKPGRGLFGSPDGDQGLVDIEQKEVLGEGNVQIEIDGVAPAGTDQILTVRAEQGRGALHGEL